MPAASQPSGADQERFWSVWNTQWRDPESLNAWSLRRGEAILRLIGSLPLQNPRILDLGCGTGWLTERLALLGQVVGVDLAEAAIARAKSRSPHLTFLLGDFFHIPLPAGHFDVVVSQEVIAHVDDQAAYLDRAAFALRAGGYLILTTPNKFVLERAAFDPQPPEHIERWLTRRSLIRLLRPRFRVLRTMTILPLGHRGLLRVVNSHKLNAILAQVASPTSLTRWKERAGLGYTIITVAQKRAEGNA
jgi:2-polyprenyl-3-methyl-5-hydroxy-6-metoxy-1,4-benzoquinol methylase